jgi:hypothetical protein
MDAQFGTLIVANAFARTTSGLPMSLFNVTLDETMMASVGMPGEQLITVTGESGTKSQPCKKRSAKKGKDNCESYKTQRSRGYAETVNYFAGRNIHGHVHIARTSEAGRRCMQSEMERRIRIRVQSEVTVRGDLIRAYSIAPDKRDQHCNETSWFNMQTYTY